MEVPFSGQLMGAWPMRQNSACENAFGRCACALHVPTYLSPPRAWPCRAREGHDRVTRHVAVAADGTFEHARAVRARGH
eukprot:2194474-Lingulodinium_polyedra.AAC.1